MTTYPQDNKSWEENWSEEFDEKFVEKPEPYTTQEPPYKIGERNYTGEHYVMPAYKFKLNIGQAEIKRFIHSTLNKEREKAYKDGFEEGILKLGKTAQENYKKGMESERNRLIEKVEKMKKKGFEHFQNKYHIANKNGYNQALSEILTILKEGGKN